MSEFTYENEFQYYIDEPTNNSHIDNSDKDTSNESKPDGFQLVIYSKNESVFSKVCCETEVLTQNTKLFQLYCEEAVHFVRMGQKSFEDMYHVCMIIDQDACKIILHGLTLDEIQRCWEHIDNDVKLGVETTKQIPLERHECMYLEKTQGDKLRQSSCDVTFPQQIKCGKYLVSIQGKIQDVQSVESRIADLRKAKIQMIKFNVRCRMSLMVMWRKRWSDFIKDKRNVVIQFDDNLKDSSKHGHSMIQVTFEIIGTDVDVLRCIESTLCNEETEERIINVLKVSKSALMDVKKLPLFSTFPLAIADTNQESGTITLVPPKFLSSNLDIAEKEILKFFELHADVSKEIIFQDPIFRLILASPTMLIDYINTAKDIAEPEKVTVHVLKPSDQARIKLMGNKLAVKKVESLIHTQFESTVSYLEYSQTVPSNCILATNEFLQFESELQNNHCVTLSYPRPRCQSKVLHTKVIKSKLFSHCLQLSICYGSIVYEEVDAIVNAANEDLKHVSGIAISIVVGGGAIIQSESDEYVQLNGKVATGTCVSLGAGKLPCKRIIHAVSPECHGESNEEQIVYDTVYNCLKRADRENLKTIALPAIGTGIFGIPEEVCASASLRAVYDYCQAIIISNISAIEFVLHTPSTLKQFSLAFESTFLSIIEENLTINLEETTSWLWKNDNGSYSPYTPDLSAELTKVYEKSPEGSVAWVFNKKTYHIDFSSMTQTNSSTGFQREIRQIIMPPPDPNEAAQWMYMGENYCWSYYTSQDSQIIERMYQNVITVPTVLTIEGNTYAFDFKQKFQVNVKTRHKRQIMRVDTNSMNEKGTTNKECNDSNEHQFHEDENISDEKLTIKLRGPKDDLQKAKAKLHEKLTSLYTYASNPLFIPFALKMMCCQTAEKYNVTCVIDKENSKCKGKKQMLKLTLSGLATDVLHVKTCIQEEIDDYDARDDEYPEEWENLSECETVELQLFQLKRGSNEWKSVEQKFTSTMSHPHHIVEITRIQNTWLWSNYMFQKKRMSKRNDGIINELDLFHGTRKNLPQEIYTSQVGFDVRYSNCGKWGWANYFAEKASYSDTYAHTTPDGTKEIFLVKVLTGKSCTDYLKGAAQLRKPPLRSSGSDSRLQEHYDTVTGWIGDCNVYMTYDNDKAYPEMVI